MAQRAADQAGEGADPTGVRRMVLWLRRNGLTLLATLLLLGGIGALSYPTFSDWWNSTRQSQVIRTYASDVDAMEQEQIEAQIGSALAYNRQVAEQGVNWRHNAEQTAAYLAELTSPNREVMGYISIEKIGVMLPIYHTTDEAVLATSIGHLEGSSLPVGAASYSEETGSLADPTDGSHCVLSGHRGLPSAKLFSDLNLLEEGDAFQLVVLDRVLTYEVDQVKVVTPEQMGDLEIVAGRDLCTLVTCTPYGVNTHRLLVRGTRVPTPNDVPAPVPEVAWWERLLPWWPLGLLAACVLLVLVARRVHRRNVRRRRAARSRSAAAKSVCRGNVDGGSENQSFRNIQEQEHAPLRRQRARS